MAAQPQWRAFCARMASDPMNEELAFDLLADGKPVRVVAAHFHTSRQQMSRWFTFTEAREARYKAAQQAGAHSLNEESLEIVDAPIPAGLMPGEASAELQRRKQRVDQRTRLAGQINPALRDAQQPGSVTNIIGTIELHLDALRSRGGPDAAPPLPPPRGPVRALPAPVDAEVEADD